MNKDFLDSLDLPHPEMEKFIPYVLQDLWELGSVPEYIYQLIDKNVNVRQINRIIDFGCGKGAVLIHLAHKFSFQGQGIDIVPEFIGSARQLAIENALNDRLDFRTGDILSYIDNTEKYDMVIYGHDSEILGDVFESILRLRKRLTDSGYLILEIAFTPDHQEKIEGLPTESELIRQLDRSGMKIVDKIFWDIHRIKWTNSQNNKLIHARIDELKKKHPENVKIFDEYMNVQIEECKLIENNTVCSTWLLKK